MESLRNFLTGPRLFIVVAACALPFVFLGTSSLSDTTGNSLGSINGENVTQADFQVATNLAIQKYKDIYGESFELSELSDEIQLEIIKQELIIQKTLLANARSMGFVNDHTRTLAKKNIIANNAFWVDGTFNEDIFEAQANANGFTKEEYIEQISLLLATDQFRSAIGTSSFALEKESRDLASILEQTINLNFIKVDSLELSQSITNTKEELLEYYKNNELKFFSDESRSFSYFILNSKDYEDLVKVPDNYIQSSYENYLANNSDNSEIRIAHLMIDKSNHDSEASALSHINNIKDELSVGESFETLVEKYSDDIVTKDSGGDLEYFDADIFPEQFSMAINNLELNDISDVVELDDSYHLIKVTEYNKFIPVSLEEMEKVFVQELVETESIALMNDDFNSLDSLIITGVSINEISNSIKAELKISKNNTFEIFDSKINNTEIRDYIFSPDTEIGVVTSFEKDDSIIILSLSEIIQPALQPYEEVQDEVSQSLTSMKTVTKQNLLLDEIAETKISGTVDSFISAYSFIKSDSFINVARGSSLLPQEVLSEAFKLLPGESTSTKSISGDDYIIDLISINKPSEEQIDNVIAQYEQFSAERFTQQMNDLISSDLFDSSNVNLNNIVF
jgi:peptidyl-prolyl cis-trans isomerase D